MLKIIAQRAFEVFSPEDKGPPDNFQKFLYRESVIDANSRLNYLIDAIEKGMSQEHLLNEAKRIRAKLQDALNEEATSNAGFAGRRPDDTETGTTDVLTTVPTPGANVDDYWEEIGKMRGRKIGI